MEAFGVDQIYWVFIASYYYRATMFLLNIKIREINLIWKTFIDDFSVPNILPGKYRILTKNTFESFTIIFKILLIFEN